MKSKEESEDEKDMLDDLDFIYNSYRTMLSSGKTSITSLNTVIRTLKEVHKYFSIDSENGNKEEDIK